MKKTFLSVLILFLFLTIPIFGKDKKPVVISVTHNSTGTLKSGDTLIVTMRGTPGCTAFFDITNLVFGVFMNETSPGNYEGKYTVLASDSVEDATVVGHLLNDKNKEASLKAGVMVNIGTGSTGGIRFAQIMPEENSTADNARPNILIVIDSNYDNKGINPKTVKLLLNGNDVTSKAVINNFTTSYNPPSNLPQGNNKVSFSALDYYNRQIYKEWSFNISSSTGNKFIYSVTHNCDTTLQPGYKLMVTMKGVPGGQASFDIENFKTGILMLEDKNNRGIYKGEYTVAKGDKVKKSYVLCYLKVNNQKESLMASNPVSFGQSTEASLQAPVITSPQNGDTINLPLVVKGTGVPGYAVEVTVSYEINLYNVVGIGGDSKKQTVSVSKSGTFEATFDFPIKTSGSKFTIKAISINNNGEKSSQTTITVNNK
jgi:hypothetical protein